MSREQKFRAWDRSTLRYYYFDFATMYGYEGEGCGVLTSEGGAYGGTYINYNSGFGFDGMNPNVEIEEYTGRHDKNGAGIYEGDIWRTEMGFACYQVRYDAPCFTLHGYDNGDYYYGGCADYHPWERGEVVGNIRENPELIDEGA